MSDATPTPAPGQPGANPGPVVRPSDKLAAATLLMRLRGCAHLKDEDIHQAAAKWLAEFRISCTAAAYRGFIEAQAAIDRELGLAAAALVADLRAGESEGSQLARAERFPELIGRLAAAVDRQAELNEQNRKPKTP